MNDFEITYPTISQRLKLLMLAGGGYLLIVSVAISILEALQKDFSLYFFVGIAGALLGLLLILSVTLWKPKPVLGIGSDDFRIYLPKQKIDGVIAWENVKQLGIGISYLTMATNDHKNYKIDLENLTYSDLKRVKTKLIEICEAKSIPYNSIV